MVYTRHDCFIHCIESESGIFYNDFSRAYGDQALKLAGRSLQGREAVKMLPMMRKLMIASLFGGLSLTYSEVGACHAFRMDCHTYLVCAMALPIASHLTTLQLSMAMPSGNFKKWWHFIKLTFRKTLHPPGRRKKLHEWPTLPTTCRTCGRMPWAMIGKIS
jgi:hypothetical protein